jgi:hypothetical protein
MRKITTTTKILRFNELSEKAQENAIDLMRDINTDHEWWDFTENDIATIGLKLVSFDTNRGQNCVLECILGHHEIADKILKNHSDSCDTYKLAIQFLKDRDSIVNNAPLDADGEYESTFDLGNELDDIENEFIKSLQIEYLSLLSKEHEHLISDKSIQETIECNEYEFTEKGELY